MLPQFELKEPLCIEDIDIDFNNKKFSIIGSCVNCNMKHHWKDIRFLTRNVLICDNCGRQHKVPVPNSVKNAVDFNLRILLTKYDKVAFWGINDYIYEFLKQIESITNHNVYFVDLSTMKQGSKLNNKVIYSPEIIRDEDIKLVIISALSFFTAIEKEVQDNFRNVELSMTILDLIKIDQ